MSADVFDLEFNTVAQVYRSTGPLEDACCKGVFNYYIEFKNKGMTAADKMLILAAAKFYDYLEYSLRDKGDGMDV